MSETIKIYVRTDLRTSSNKKVPNGKMASQTAHALMGGFLSLFENLGEELKLLSGNELLLKAYINKELKIEILPIKSEVELLSIYENNKANSVLIQDQGRTAFDKPTITTLAVSPVGYNYKHFVNCESETGNRYASKQVIIINKTEIKDKWEMFSVVAESSLGFLLDLVASSKNEDSISLNKQGLKNWVNGAFAKITVKPKTKTFDDAVVDLEKAKSSGVYTYIVENNAIIKAISIGADDVDVIDQFTKDGYSLA